MVTLLFQMVPSFVLSSVPECKKVVMRVTGRLRALEKLYSGTSQGSTGHEYIKPGVLKQIQNCTHDVTIGSLEPTLCVSSRSKGFICSLSVQSESAGSIPTAKHTYNQFACDSPSEGEATLMKAHNYIHLKPGCQILSISI